MPIQNDAARLTGVITTPREALDKLWWNLGTFEHSLSNRDFGEGQGFAFLDCATAAGAVHAWTCAHFHTQPLPVVLDVPLSDFLMDTVRHSRLLRAVSNVSKHAQDTKGYWSGSNQISFRADRGTDLDALLDSADRDFVSFASKVLSGEIWAESELFDDQGNSLGFARQIVTENVSDWDSIHARLGLR